MTPFAIALALDASMRWSLLGSPCYIRQEPIHVDARGDTPPTNFSRQGFGMHVAILNSEGHSSITRDDGAKPWTGAQSKFLK